MRQNPFALVAPALLLAVTACATAVGEGRYMLIGNQAGRVVVEIHA